MSRTRPLFSKSAVNRAADNLRLVLFSERDEEIVENWRASHGVVLNTFRQTLNRHAANKGIVVAQRLKRRSTIYDKLRREPKMLLSRMQDIAGCRLIFDNIKDLYYFRDIFYNSRFKHSIVNEKDDYDYIKHPKSSGYRSVHDVYKYKSFSGKSKDSYWDGLRIELQYRTNVQHAWATTVELFDQISGEEVKYSKAKDEIIEYFQLSSWALSRGLENGPFLPILQEVSLLKRMNEIDERHSIFDTLNKISSGSYSEAKLGTSGYVLLIGSKDGSVEIFIPRKRHNTSAAIRAYFSLEKQYPESDIVLVRSNSENSVRSAFPNYFRDARNYIRYSLEAIGSITKSNRDRFSELQAADLDT